METLFIGYGDGLVRVSLNGSVEHRQVIEGVPVPMVAVEPGRPERVYAATLGRGLWRSDDAGNSFAAVPDVGHELVWSVAAGGTRDDERPGRVYVGTQMSALYRSDDGGESFGELESVQALPSRASWSFPPAPDTHHVHQITLSPQERDTVVFGVELGGVFRSADAGESWELTDADPDPHTLRTHPTEPGRMYQGGGAAYYATTDEGATWRRNIAGIPDDVRYFYSLAVDAGDPENVLLSGARDPFSGHAVILGVPVWSGIFRLVNDVWEEVREGLPPNEGTAMGTLAAGGPGVFYYVTEPGEIYRSEDGGESFARVDEGESPVRGTKARSVLAVATEGESA